MRQHFYMRKYFLWEKSDPNTPALPMRRPLGGRRRPKKQCPKSEGKRGLQYACGSPPFQQQ
jgi:hypothetical protein